MERPVADIIVPVWNRPTETRTCLVNLLNFSPDVRLILVNNGSERETENLLEEFADGLDQRAVLIGSATNRGYVRAVNMGLERLEAETAVIVRSTSVVTRGWLEPLVEVLRSREEVGIVVPRLERTPLTKKRQTHVPVITEVSHGDFAAMAIKKRMYDRIGGFDEGLDGAAWCLKDFSFRARKAGYLTCAAEQSLVYFQDEVQLGSPVRREELLERCRAIHERSWGGADSYCVYFPPATTIDTLRQRLESILLGARQGHSFTLLVSSRLYREAAAAGLTAWHRSIAFTSLPQLFPIRRAARIAEAMCARDKDTVLVNAGEQEFPGGFPAISLAGLERLVAAAESDKFMN